MGLPERTAESSGFKYSHNLGPMRVGSRDHPWKHFMEAWEPRDVASEAQSSQSFYKSQHGGNGAESSESGKSHLQDILDQLVFLSLSTDLLSLTLHTNGVHM